MPILGQEINRNSAANCTGQRCIYKHAFPPRSLRRLDRGTRSGENQHMQRAGENHGFQKAEEKAKNEGFKIITLEVRETQHRAIQLYEHAGFIKTGTNPKAAYVNGKYIAGHYYYKELKK